MRSTALLVAAVSLAGCLDASPTREHATAFLDDVAVLGEVGDPALEGLTPDVVVQLDLLPADPTAELSPPEDPAFWPAFVDEHPEFLAPEDDGWAAPAGAVPAPDGASRPVVTFDWRKFFSDRGRELSAKQGMVLAQAGLIAVAIPSPVPEPSDAAAGVYLAVGTAVVLVTITWSAVHDPAVQQVLVHAMDAVDARVSDLATAIAAAIDKALSRTAGCPPMARLVAPARRVAGFLPAYRDEVLACFDGQTIALDRMTIVSPDDGMLTVGFTNIGPLPLGLYGVHPEGVDIVSLNVVPRPVPPGMREVITFPETRTKRVVLIGSILPPVVTAIGIQ